MELKKLLKDIKGVFKLPKKRFYFGKIVFGCPYFNPSKFLSSIINVRKLKLRTEEEIIKYKERYPYDRNEKNIKFSNIPMVQRNKSYLKKIFNNYYYITIGWPVYIYWHGLGWKDKYESPRYEWSPGFYIFFFKWQFCIFWNSFDNDNDQYYEQILWYLEYAGKDIKKAKETWPWSDSETKKSTWDDKYLE